MLLSLFGSRRSRSEADELKDQVTALQGALLQCRAVVRRTKDLKLGLTATIAALSFALGLVLGIYNEPIRDATTNLAGRWGLIEDSEAPYLAYQKGRYATALRRLRPLAERGDARAQSTLGLMYANGRGVATNALEAGKWFRVAASQGNAPAQYQLGSLYANGQGVPQDYAEAAKWYRLAADQNYPQAQYELGFLYANGDGVALDYVRAHMWLNLAAAQFSTAEFRSRRAAVSNREVVESKMTRDQIAEAHRLAHEWKPKQP